MHLHKTINAATLSTVTAKLSNGLRRITFTCKLMSEISILTLPRLRILIALVCYIFYGNNQCK